MPTSTLTETINRTGYTNGRSVPISYTRTNSGAPAKGVLYEDLASNTLEQITIPSGSEWVYITGPSGNTTNILIAGDTGATVATETIPLHPTRTSRLAVVSGTTLLWACGDGGAITGVRFLFK